MKIEKLLRDHNVTIAETKAAKPSTLKRWLYRLKNNDRAILTGIILLFIYVFFVWIMPTKSAHGYWNTIITIHATFAFYMVFVALFILLFVNR